MKQKNIFYFLILVLSAFVSSKCNAFVGSTRELVVLSEYGENENYTETFNMPFNAEKQPQGMGAATYLLLNALYQNVPVLVPAPIWRMVAEHKKIFDYAILPQGKALLRKYYGHTAFLDSPRLRALCCEQFVYTEKIYKNIRAHLDHATSIQELKQTLWSDPTFDNAQIPASLHDRSNHARISLLMCSVVPIDRFIVKKIIAAKNPQAVFYLFVPRDLIDLSTTSKSGSGVSKALSKKQPRDKSGLSLLEKKLGLKIDHFADAEDLFNSQPHSHDCNAHVHYTHTLGSTLNQLFVKKNEVPEHLQHKWTLYIMGHGIYNQKAKDELLKIGARTACDTPDNDKKNLSNVSGSGHVHQNITTKIRQKQEYIDRLHGENKIAGLPLDEFADILRFFDTAITTKLLFCSSCSAGGKQFLDVLTASPSNSAISAQTPLALSYPVIADTLIEAPSTNLAPTMHVGPTHDGTRRYPIAIDRLIDWKNKRIIIDTPYNFPAFFACARTHKAGPNVINTLLGALAPTYHCKTDVERPNGDKRVGQHDDQDKSGAVKYAHARALGQHKSLTRSDINNLPSLCLPYTHHFAPVDGDNRFLALTQKSIQAYNCRSCHDPIVTIPQEKELIMLCVSKIPAVLEFERSDHQKEFPSIISFIPGKAAHKINEIRAPDYHLSEIINALFVVGRGDVPKRIRIKKLICIDDCTSSHDHTNSRKNTVRVFKDALFFSSVECGQIGSHLNGFGLRSGSRFYSAQWDAHVLIPKDMANRVHLSRKPPKLYKSINCAFADANEHEKEVCTNASVVITPEEISRLFAANKKQ